MIDLQTERDTRKAVLEAWICEGKLREGVLKGKPCRKPLMELDMNRPSAIRKVCERCGHVNVFVEAYRPS